MKSVQLHGYSHQTRETLLAALVAAVDQNGGWLLGQRSLSVSTVELQLEVQKDAAADFYAGLVGTGLELTRYTHQALAGLCTCSQAEFGRGLEDGEGVVPMDLNVCFLEGLTGESFLLYSSIPA